MFQCMLISQSSLYVGIQSYCIIKLFQVSAQNAWLSMELSHIEAKVTVLKDQVEI